MSKYTSEHLVVLLAQMYRDVNIRSLALLKLEPAHFTNQEVGGSFAHSLLFEIMARHVEEFKTVPDRATMAAEFDSALRKYFAADAPEVVSFKADFVRFIKYLDLVDDRSLQKCRDIVAWVYETCVSNKELAVITEEMASARPQEYSLFAERLRNLQAQAQSILGGNSKTGVGTMDMGEKVDRANTYIPFIDSRLGRGAGPSKACTMGIIAPQGSGKTTLGVQLGVSQALAGKHASLVLVEEGLTVPVRRNILACTTGIPTTTFETAKDNIDEAAKLAGMDLDVVRTKVELVNKHLHVLDVNETGGGLAEIEAELMALAMAGTKPEYVYIDWAGILANRMISLGYKRRKFDNMLSALKELTYTVAGLAQQYQNTICIAQQMAPALATKGFHVLHDQFCAADCRGFTEPMKYVFVINKPDPRTKASLFQIPKARNDTVNQVFAVRLRGELAMFEDVNDQFELKAKRFIARGSRQSTTAVPREGNDAKPSAA